jgi:hypothetical protein
MDMDMDTATFRIMRVCHVILFKFHDVDVDVAFQKLRPCDLTFRSLNSQSCVSHPRRI